MSDKPLLPIKTGLTTTARKRPAGQSPVAKMSRVVSEKALSAIHAFGRAVDHTISVFAPSIALKRVQSRMMIRSFDAATTSRTNYDVDYRRTDADSELRNKRIRLMGISREEQRNDPFFSNGLRTSRNNVIGDDQSEDGIKITANTGNEKLDVIINDFWQQYKNRIHLRGRWHFNELISLAHNSFMLSGEALNVISDIKPKGSDLPFSIEDLEPDHLPTSNEMWSSGAYAPFVPGPDGGSIRDGVEYDAEWRIQAYHILPFHPGNEFLFQPITTRRVPVERVIHYFEAVRPEQARGVPFAVAGLNSIYNSNELIKSEMNAARLQANIPIHFETAPSAMPFNSGANSNPVMDGDGNPVYQIQTGTYTYGPSKPTMMKSERVNAQFVPFCRFEGMRGGAAMNMSPSSYMKDSSGLNFSSLREDKMEDRRGYANLQGYHARYFIEKMWPWFIRALAITDKIQIPDEIFDFEKFAASKICRVNVAMPSWGYVNPEQEVKADGYAIATGIKLPSETIGRRDWKGHCEQYKKEVDEAKANGLTFAWMEGETAGSKKSSGEDLDSAGVQGEKKKSA